jgi:hypothetical protein
VGEVGGIEDSELIPILLINQNPSLKMGRYGAFLMQSLSAKGLGIGLESFFRKWHYTAYIRAKTGYFKAV